MHGIILITHAPLASAFLEAATHVYNQKQNHILALDVLPQLTELDLNSKLKTWLWQQIEQEMTKLIEKNIEKNVNHLQEITHLSLEYLIMNDVIGATPFHFAKHVLQNHYLLSEELTHQCQNQYLQLSPYFKINLKFALCSYLNLPALLKAICYIQSPLEGVLEKIENAELKCQPFNIIH